MARKLAYLISVCPSPLNISFLNTEFSDKVVLPKFVLHVVCCVLCVCCLMLCCTVWPRFVCLLRAVFGSRIYYVGCGFVPFRFAVFCSWYDFDVGLVGFRCWVCVAWHAFVDLACKVSCTVLRRCVAELSFDCVIY